MPLLFFAARTDFRPEHTGSLKAAAEAVRGWQDFPNFAEEHNLAPLFLANAREAKIAIPDDTLLQLQGLAMRARLANQARSRTLVEILETSHAAGIEPILLKGTALSRLVYAHPDLRPMRDIDLLAPRDQVRGLQNLLLNLGFRPPEDRGQPRSTHHLSELSRTEGHFQMTVEVHYQLFDPTWRARQPRVEGWIARARPFEFEGQPALSLSLEDMLWHTYQHMINGGIRFGSIADLIGLAEKFADQVDWPLVHRQYPGVITALSIFHALSPLDERLIRQAQIPTGKPASTIGEDWQGWPRIPLRRVRELGLGNFLRLTFLPSEWWLRLYYGIENGRPTAAYRWLVHPFEVSRIALVHLALHFQQYPE